MAGSLTLDPDTVDPLAEVVDAFEIPGQYLEAQPFGSGHIQDTWAATFLEDDRIVRVVLQRLNESIFPEPQKLMENLARVLAHLRQKLQAAGTPDLNRRAPQLIRTRKGEPFARDAAGRAWRALTLIEGTRSFDVPDSPRRAYESARAFGTFVSLLSDLPPQELHETIPRFHHTPSYLARLEEVAAQDPAGRVAEVGSELEFARARANLARFALDLQAAGRVPERVIHNDTKLNNVLFDLQTDKALCVVDLDTVMPGLTLFDFGDMVRSTTSPTAEDEPDVTKIEARPEMFEALVRGYLSVLRPVLTRDEIAYLFDAGRLITLECGTRFLIDHLSGDRYFKIHRPGQNLDRARAQFALVRSLERQAETLRKLVATVAVESAR